MYRVVQETLTNAVKHVPGASVRVGITHEADRTRVSIESAAPPAGEPTHRTEGSQAGTGGQGLTGLRERVTVLGGSLRTGPHDGGFRVTAVLPHQAPAVPLSPAAEPGPPADHAAERTGENLSAAHADDAGTGPGTGRGTGTGTGMDRFHPSALGTDHRRLPRPLTSAFSGPGLRGLLSFVGMAAALVGHRRTDPVSRSVGGRGRSAPVGVSDSS
ncbi:ATP-binding protein [Streptomyces sp. NPDC051742]|uniref:ATP-binding protein n=1 Tax=unclassified Streptomyces TaxID=2593676 RepID=UPI00341BF550